MGTYFLRRKSKTGLPVHRVKPVVIGSGLDQEAIAQVAQAVVDRLQAAGLMTAGRRVEASPEPSPRLQKPMAVPVDMPVVKRDTGLEGSLGEIQTKVGATIAPDVAEALKKVLGGNNEGNGT